MTDKPHPNRRHNDFLWLGSVETEDALFLVIRKRKPDPGAEDRDTYLKRLTRQLSKPKKAGK